MMGLGWVCWGNWDSWGIIGYREKGKGEGWFKKKIGVKFYGVLFIMC